MIQKKRKIKVPRDCNYCKDALGPSFKDVSSMSKYMSERGRILGKDRTGVCAKHQRMLAREVKRARHMALLPFVAGL
jgi:small subunit ribosomal protein S18